jgi:hypothetical protein
MLNALQEVTHDRCDNRVACLDEYLLCVASNMERCFESPTPHESFGGPEFFKGLLGLKGIQSCAGEGFPRVIAALTALVPLLGDVSCLSQISLEGLSSMRSISIDQGVGALLDAVAALIPKVRVDTLACTGSILCGLRGFKQSDRGVGECRNIL